MPAAARPIPGPAEALGGSGTPWPGGGAQHQPSAGPAEHPPPAACCQANAAEDAGGAGGPCAAAASAACRAARPSPLHGVRAASTRHPAASPPGAPAQDAGRGGHRSLPGGVGGLRGRGPCAASVASPAQGMGGTCGGGEAELYRGPRTPPCAAEGLQRQLPAPGTDPSSPSGRGGCRGAEPPRRRHQLWGELGRAGPGQGLPLVPSAADPRG